MNFRIEELEKENANLTTEIDRLKNDSLYIEKIARKELGMIRQGEIIYRIIPPQSQESPNTSGEK